MNDPIGIRPSPQQKPSATGELRKRRCAVLGRHRRLMEASNDPLVCHISGCPPKKKEMTSTKMMMIHPWSSSSIVRSKNLPTLGIPGRFLSLVLIQPNHA